MDKKNALRCESVLNQNSVKVYTDGSKLDGRVGADFYAEYPNNSPKTSIFSPWNTQHCVPGKSLCYSRSGKESTFGKKCAIIVVLVDSQATIKSVIKCSVTLIIAVPQLHKNLNQLGKPNHVSIAWISGHAGVHGNDVADHLVKSGSKSKMHGPEPFITVHVC